MFDKIQYKLLFSNCKTKDEYKQLIKKYMDEFNVPYITAKQHISLQKIEEFESKNNIKYEQAFLDTYNEIIENGYNISLI
jgi:2-oxo-4-hydroxy-4-carboxy--5-ureidoimidazoline (OHCU) decarboxylase